MRTLNAKIAIRLGVAMCLFTASPTLFATFGVPGISRTSSIGDLTLTGVYPRIFTPNGDGANDKVVFHLSNPEQLPVTGKIYDLPGAQIVSLAPGSDQLVWDGKDSDGRIVPGGIYLYQIDFEGQVLTGTVVVAR